jgi:transcriptional regulator with XRE-family HTH domain
MTKSQARKLFGSQTAMAQAMGITSGAISQWPEMLDQRTVDELVGAALRVGIPHQQIPGLKTLCEREQRAHD